jgi:diaphanous 1
VKDVLEYALAVGNYLNGTTPRGGAWGFKFENLDKLADVKTLDNKQNLLQYVITQIEKKHGKHLITSEADLEKFDKISKLPVG